MFRLFFTFSLILSSIGTRACHLVTISESNAVDNGDGTYTYTFDVCVGAEDTYGFFLDFTGPSNVISYTADVTATSTGTTINGSVPTISGSGDIEYGDWDNNSTPLFSGGTNDCVSVTVTVDDPITEATIGGTQIDYSGGPCAGTSTDLTSCFASNATYQISIDLPTCNGNPSYFIDLDGTIIDAGPVDGSTINYTYCGGCATTFSAGTDKNNCDLNSYSVSDINGDVIVSGTGNATNASLGSCSLPVELYRMNVQHEYNQNTISWSTSSESNSDYFEVQYSHDGFTWRPIQTVGASGFANELNKYSVSHKDYKNVINYYRIKQVDFNGDYEFFDILSIDNAESKNVVKRIDLTGREIDKNYTGICIEIYSDGSSKKRFHL